MYNKEQKVINEIYDEIDRLSDEVESLKDKIDAGIRLSVAMMDYLGIELEVQEPGIRVVKKTNKK